MERSLFTYIWKYSRVQQLVLLGLTVLTFPILYATLELPKRIINDAIGGPEGGVVLFGVEVGQVGYLMLLCGAFLVAVIVWGLVKMRLNTMKGIMAERLLRRFRYQLIARVLRFPLPHFRRTSQGEMVSIVTSEAEPLGGIMGDAVAQPVFQGGQMLTILGFLFVQNVWLGLTAIALIPLQAWLIPKLQRQVNLLNKERVKEVRRFSEQIGETMAGVEDIRANGVVPYTLAQFTSGLGRLFTIRHQIYQKKYFMKFVNNLITQLTPFFFFSIGGYLVIQGQLTLGALVAALAAYKDLAAPWKELLAYYNQLQDMSLRYETIVEQFAPPGMIDAALMEGRPESVPRLNGAAVFENVTVREPDGGTILDDLSLTIPGGKMVAIQAANTAERQAITQALSRTILPTAGRVMLDGHDLNTLHQGVVAARVGVVGQKPYLFKGRLEDNVRLPLRTAPCPDHAAAPEIRIALEEAARTGNSGDAGDVPWLSIRDSRFDSEDQIAEWWQQIAEAMGTDGFLFDRGMNSAFERARHPRLAERLVALRPEARRRVAEAGLDRVIYPFDIECFNPGQAIGGNILYAVSKRSLRPDELARDPEFDQFLDEAALRGEALQLGADLLAVVAITFEHVGGEHPLLRRLGIETEVFDWLARIDERLEAGGIEGLCDLDSRLLAALPFCISAEQIGSFFSDELKERILDARRSRPAGLTGWGARCFSPIDPDGFIEGLTVLENLAFGKIKRNAGKDFDRLRRVIGDLLKEEGLKTDVAVLVGDIGTTAGGTNLPPSVHERIAFVRAAMRRPDLLVLDHAMTSFEPQERLSMRSKIRALMPETTIVYLEPKVERPEDFDLVMEIDDGKLVDSGIDPAETDTTMPGQSDLAQKIRAFGRVPLFSGLARSQLRVLAFASEWFEVKAGGYIFHEGDEADAAYLVTGGRGELVWDDVAELDFEQRVVEAGRLIGDLSVFQGHRRTLSLVVREDMTGLRIGAVELMEVIESDPEMAVNLLRTVSGYLIGLSEQMHDVIRDQ